MFPVTKGIIFAFNIVVLTGALIVAFRSRLSHNPGDIISLLVIASFAHFISWMAVLFELGSPTGGRAVIVAISVFNATTLTQLFTGGLDGALPSYLFNACCVTEFVGFAYIVLFGKEPTWVPGQPIPTKVKPLQMELQGVEAQLEKIQKRVAELKRLTSNGAN